MHPKQVPEEIREYFGIRNEISEVNGKLKFKSRIVIPESMRGYVLDRIHDGHQGVTKCRERARLSVWWPGLSRSIAQKVASCEFCLVNQPTQRKEPLRTTPLPDRPWQMIAADLAMSDGQDYLIVTDYYSRYIEIAHTTKSPHTTSKRVIGKLKNMFARWGIPELVKSDGGPQFTSKEFEEFSKEYGFTHDPSTPHFPQGNGEAESGVRIAKRILKQDDPFLALMTYRATPTQATKESPCKLIMGREIRTRLPTLTDNLHPKTPNHKEVRKADERTKQKYKKSFDDRHGVRSLPVLEEGDQVRFKLDNEKGRKIAGLLVVV
ncbi:uncharacterized protein K02A2.6-like [Nematostella vectensis]|uniref:uncharacterized protein K02A2.6-like n=1 Tax=Nematostella vectensis TaxID=45351 RepID=UPI00138FE392|nr:uncharacterized protein K02A2.6-like [Nematostella vectensis]